MGAKNIVKSGVLGPQVTTVGGNSAPPVGPIGHIKHIVDIKDITCLYAFSITIFVVTTVT